MRRFQHSLTPVDTINGIGETLFHSDHDVVDGERVWVRSVGCEFVYRRGSGLVANGSFIIASAFGDGVWVRSTDTSDVSWLAQLTWYIDPTNGDDENSGIDASHPIKTDFERQMRMRPGPEWFAGEYHLYYLNDVPATDPVRITGQRNRSSTIFLHGSATAGHGVAPALYTNTVDAHTDYDRATNVPVDITSNALPVSWTASGLVGKRFRQTTGANVGAMGWIVSDLGAKAARTSQWSIQDTFTGGLVPNIIGGPPPTPTNTDTITVEDLRAIDQLLIDVQSTEDLSVNHMGYGVVAESLEIGLGTNGWGLQMMSGDSVLFEGCDIDLIAGTTGHGGQMTFVNCRLRLPWFYGQRAFCWGGYASGGSAMVYDGAVDFDCDFMVQGSSIQVLGGNVTIGVACMFDSSASGLSVQGGQTVVRAGRWIGFVTGWLWGNGNTTYGVSVAAGSKMRMTAASQAVSTLTGGTLDIEIAGAATANAWTVITATYTAPIATTWALLNTNVAGGGFEGNMIDPASRAALTL